MTTRNESELKVLADAVDRLLRGDYAGACYLLMLRFQQAEMAHGDGGWKHARHLLDDSSGTPPTTARGVRSAAVMEESRRYRQEAATSSMGRSPSPRRGESSDGASR